MSGIVGSKLNIRGSGRIAKLGTDGQVLTSAGAGKSAVYEDLAGGISWQSVVTGSTMTAVAGNGYPINTTSNTCTITLPGSASVGDEIIFTDYARNWATNKIIIDSNGLNYQGDADTFTVEYSTAGQSLHIVYADATKGWIPISDDDVADVPSIGWKNTEGIVAYGWAPDSLTAVSNKISTSGVVASDVSGVGTARNDSAATEYGGDKGIFAYGHDGSAVSMSNLVNTSGVIGSDVSGVGTVRLYHAACHFGSDRGIFGFGHNGSAIVSLTNLVTNVGVVGADVTGVGTARRQLAACEYGGDKGIFGYGDDGSVSSLSNLVSNVGVVASDVTGVGSARGLCEACSYAGDKGIFAYGSTGSNVSLSNLVSNAGVVASDVTGVGTARRDLAACEYGGDKGIFSYGYVSGVVGMSNLVSNAGVVATDVSVVGTARTGPAGCSFNT